MWLYRYEIFVCSIVQCSKPPAFMHLGERLLCIVIPSLTGVIDHERSIHQVVTGCSDNADISESLKSFLSLYLTLVSKGVGKAILCISKGLSDFISLKDCGLAYQIDKIIDL
ncbi:hypothetical protein ASE88_04970 [Sphingomonas sp. Leaf38]|nr:hypothetical protein ASE88_04970 [Sphingomonas sp. Leaf38]